ncbi:MAG: hypothetical protein RL112_1176 [Planctomycetota bacterium]
MRLVAAEARHHPDYARLVGDLGTGDPIPPLGDWLEHIAPDMLVHEVDGRMVAWGRVQLFGEELYVRHLLVAGEWRRRGLGRALMGELAARARARGAVRWRLNVDPRNEVALGLYRSLGLRASHRLWALRIAASARFPSEGSLPAQRDSTRGPLLRRVAAPAEDDAVERRFELLPGFLARHRSRRGASVLVHERSGELVACAACDPFYSGAFPVRIPDPDEALRVAASLRPMATPGRGHLQIVLERDEASAELLLASGATLNFETLHLVGALAAADR